MKILYLGNFQNKFSDTTEKHIKFALEKLGHEVVEINESEFDVAKIVALKGDLFLFHKGGQAFDVQLPTLIELLNKLTCKKVCWYFDKIYKERIYWAETVVPFVDYFFVTDETWARRHNYKNVHILRQGIGTEDMSPGTPKDPKNEVVFVGSVYGDRINFVKGLEEVYGPKFKQVNNSFGRNLYDLCASTKVFVAPRYPQDDFYWSSRVYMILGSGGFLIHPRYEGMKHEFENGKNIVFYSDGPDLKEKIDYYLEHDEEREAIRKAGYELVTSKYTYEERTKSLLQTINA